MEQTKRIYTDLGEFGEDVARELDNHAASTTCILKEDGRLLVAVNAGLKCYGYVVENLEEMMRRGRDPEDVADSIRARIVNDWRRDLYTPSYMEADEMPIYDYLHPIE